jgi:hypothetical protein
MRKSSRLRFLSPAEMVSSACWTASFLDSSVMMKITDGQRRLYMTTPEGYLQPGEGWSWQSLRQLPLFDASSEEQEAQASHLAVEACWTYNDRLDARPMSVHTSFASQHSHQSAWDQDTQHFNQSESDERDEQLHNPMSPQLGTRPFHHRTVSLPLSSSPESVLKSSLSKRRVASFETTRGAGTGSTDLHAIMVAGKRRRISSSPEAERKGLGFTPRLSREPPSPFPSENVPTTVEGFSQGTILSRKRGTTPFAYATPHSNSNYIGRVEFTECTGGDDGDTEADAEMPNADDEWHGVEDDNQDEEHGDETAVLAPSGGLSEPDIDESGTAVGEGED